VGAYFYQVVKGEADFDSQSLNTQLKHLGYPSANITRDLGRLVDRSPKLIIQTRKEGTTQQARKRFRLTTEGIRTVQNMLKKAQGITE
jgi:DNA-binding MarR family transcriptional regulator